MNSADDIEARAAEWIARLDGREGGCDTGLLAWLAADPRHRAAYLRLLEAWRRSARLERLRPSGGSPDPDLLVPLRRPRHWLTPLCRGRRVHTAKARQRYRPVRQRRLGAGRWRAAASAAVMLAIGLGLWWLTFPPRTQVFRTGAGGLSHVVLADGSSVILNSNTLVRVRFTSRERGLWLLRGEAQFLDTHDVHRPFEVHAGNRIVLAVGTAFDVRLAPGHPMEVAVTEGRVALMAGDGTSPELTSIPPPILTAGEIARIDASELTVDRDTPQGLSRRLAWQHRELSFRGETLSEAVAEFNRYNSRRLALADRKIGSMRIGGNFDALDTASFIAALQRSFDITARTEGGTTYLSASSPR